MQDLICKKCGSVNDYEIRESSLHNTAYCLCGNYIKHVPKNESPKIHFGKYKGRDISSLTSDEETRYLYWLMNQDIKANLKLQIERHLKK